MRQLFIPNEFKALAEKTAKEFGCEVLNITFKPEKKSNVLRVTIDGEKVSLNTCADISRELSIWLDENEEALKCKSYNFEVSTPGPDRPLKTKEDFKKHIDKLVYFETKTKAADGRKRYKGRIMDVTDETVKIYITEESAEFELIIADISKARVEYEF